MIGTRDQNRMHEFVKNSTEGRRVISHRNIGGKDDKTPLNNVGEIGNHIKNNYFCSRIFQSSNQTK